MAGTRAQRCCDGEDKGKAGDHIHAGASLLKRVGGDWDNQARAYGGNLAMLETPVSEISDGGPGYYVSHKWIFYWVKTVLRRGPTQIFISKSAVKSGA